MCDDIFYVVVSDFNNMWKEMEFQQQIYCLGDAANLLI